MINQHRLTQHTKNQREGGRRGKSFPIIHTSLWRIMSKRFHMKSSARLPVELHKGVAKCSLSVAFSSYFIPAIKHRATRRKSSGWKTNKNVLTFQRISCFRVCFKSLFFTLSEKKKNFPLLS